MLYRLDTDSAEIKNINKKFCEELIAYFLLIWHEPQKIQKKEEGTQTARWSHKPKKLGWDTETCRQTDSKVIS
jgi:hypothetical protein